MPTKNSTYTEESKTHTALKFVYGVGYNSAKREGFPTKSNGKILKCYDAWRRMLQRCYDIQYKIDHPTYEGVVCCDDWKDYQNFAKWFYEKSNYQEGFELDKDLLLIDNKMYSPKTCCFLPKEVNKTLSTRGCVSTYREKDKNFTYTVFGKIVGYDRHYLSFADKVVELRNKKVRMLAEKWKKLLVQEAYDALMKYRFMYSLDGSIYRGFY